MITSPSKKKKKLSDLRITNGSGSQPVQMRNIIIRPSSLCAKLAGRT